MRRGWSYSERRSVSVSKQAQAGKRSVPGGASGLQIRERPRAGLWWVRLPLSSAKSGAAKITATFVLEELQAAARDADLAEAAFRRQVATRVAELERDRAFAYRRLNLMKAIAEAVASRTAAAGCCIRIPPSLSDF